MIPGREQIFSSAGFPDRSVLWPTQTPVHWVPGSFLGNESNRDVKPNTRLYLKLKLREKICTIYPPYASVFYRGTVLILFYIRSDVTQILFVERKIHYSEEMIPPLASVLRLMNLGYTLLFYVSKIRF